MLILLTYSGLCTYDSSLEVPGLKEGATVQMLTHAAARGAELHDKMAAVCFGIVPQVFQLLL